MDHKTTSLIAVAVVAIIAVSGFLLLNGGDEENKTTGKLTDSYPTNLMIFGNANLDDYLDENDVEYIENLLKAGNPDYSRYFMADANGDGKIDSDDVDYLRKMLDGKWEEIRYVHYLNANFEMASFDMSVDDRKIITLICPPLDNVLILNPDLLYGTDMRPDTGKYKPQYEALLDSIEERNGRQLVNVGIASSPTTELISQASKDNGGHMIVLCGGSDGSNMESALSGSGVQILRLPTWEYGGTMPGLLTLAYILDVDDGDGVSEMKRAYEYKAWYDGIESTVKNAVSQISSESRPGVSCVYAYTQQMQLLGKYTGEYNNSLKLGIDDVTAAYTNGSLTGGHGDAVNDETIAELVNKYGLNVLVGLVGTPFQIEDNNSTGSSGVDQATYSGLKAVYDRWETELGPVLGENGADFCIMGYSFLSGVSEPLGQLILGYYLYSDVSDVFNLVYIEQKVNEYCEWLGIFDVNGDGISNPEDGEWNFGSMNLLYAGEDNPKNIMNRI